MMLSEKGRAKLVADAGPVLIQGEAILDATRGVAHVIRMGTRTVRRGTVLVTDRRVIIFTKKLGGYDVSDFAYGLLTGVDHKRGLTAGHLTIRASGDSADIRQVEKADVERIAQAIRHQMARVGNGIATVDNRGAIADELGKLAALLSSGALTDEEFATQKARLLG